MALKMSLFDWCMENDKQYLLDEWNYDKNEFLIPDYVSYLSHIVIDWKCQYGHEWEEPLYNRTKMGHVCQECKRINQEKILAKKMTAEGRKQSIADRLNTEFFAIKHPLESSEWLYSDIDGVTPNNVLPASQKYATWKCSKCGHIWRTTFNNRHQGHGCIICNASGERRRKTHDVFVDEIHNMNDNINVVGKYIDKKHKIEFSCQQCGHHWYKAPENMLKYCICPVCNKSKGEQAIYKVLTDKGIIFDTQYTFSDCKYKHPLPFDFCVFDDNRKVILLIEYDGEQHFSPIDFFGGNKSFAGTQRNDNIKNEYCKRNNIDLLRIPYYEFKNIKTLIDDKIQSILTIQN